MVSAPAVDAPTHATAEPHHPTDNAHPDVTPAPPTYDSAIQERYGETEKSDLNGPQPTGAAPVMVTPLTAIGREETTVDCPRCQQAVKTRIERHPGQRATIWSVVICLCVGCLCAWIPCVMDDCKDVEHYCSQCNLALATVSPGGAVELSTPARRAAQTPSQNPGQNGQQRGGPDGQGGQAQGQTQAQQGPQQYASTPQMQQPQTQPPMAQQQQRQETGHVDSNGKPVAELS